MSFRVRPEATDGAWEVGVRMSVHDVSRALRFDREWHAALARIAADPASLPLHPEATVPETRYLALSSFPYLVLFRTADPAETVVLAILHVGSGPAAFRRAERRG